MAKKKQEKPGAGPPLVNSPEYWDERFLVDWERRGGPDQTVFFAELAIRLLPDWLRREIVQERLTVCDWGCAMGQGLQHWARLTGADG